MYYKYHVFLSIIFCFLLIFNPTNANSQNLKKWDMRIAYTPMNVHLIDKKFNSTIQAGVNYNWNTWLHSGIYIGFGVNNKKFTFGSIVPLGIRSDLHFVPLFVKKEARIDPYFSIEVGGIIFAKSILYKSSFIFNGALGIGLNLYFLKNIGIFAEYQWGTFFDTKKYFKTKNGWMEPLPKGSKYLFFPKIGLSFKF